MKKKILLQEEPNNKRLIYESGPDEKGYEYAVYKEDPHEDELEEYKGSDREVPESITRLMSHKSKEEQLLATDRLMGLFDIARRIAERKEQEEE